MEKGDAVRAVEAIWAADYARIPAGAEGVVLEVLSPGLYAVGFGAVRTMVTELQVGPARPAGRAARIVGEYLRVTAEYELPDCRCLETECVDFDAYSRLPRVVEMDGRLFGLTGWNSDRQVAFYKTGTRIARAASTED